MTTDREEDPDPEADADPGTEADADPGTEADADPGTEADADPGTEADADPGREADADDTGGTGQAYRGGDADGGILLRLPERDREAFKEPLGPVLTDAEALLAEAGDPLVTVGDAVTHHVRAAGTDPDVAVVDGLTERDTVDEAMRDPALDGDDEVWNPAATLTADLLSALRAAFDADEPITLVVAGEEDLATLPAVLALPDGASVVYGQPGEGMVHVAVDAAARERARDLFAVLEGDRERALAVLGVADE